MTRLVTENLLKTYEPAFRLGPLNFTFAEGSLSAVFGQNGSGKTTLFQILTGNADATSGQVLMDGQRMSPDRPDLKRRIGYLPQNPALPRWATPAEILAYAARLHELPDAAERISSALDFWDVRTFAGKPVAALSYGMQKRVGLALSTLSTPPMLILDEPYSGLDLQHCKALDAFLSARRKDGLTTVMSTHVVPFAARMCDQVYIMEKGQLENLAGWESADYIRRIDLVESRFPGPGSSHA